VTNMTTWTSALWNHDMLPYQWGAAIGASLVAALFDAGTRRIPNWLTGSILIGGAAWAVLAGGAGGILDGFVGCLLLAFPFAVLFVFAGGGAGDVKLMGALGMWLGVRNGAIALCSVSLVGIVLALAFAVSKSRLRAVFSNLAAISRSAIYFIYGGRRLGDVHAVLPETKDMQAMPYGVAIFLGTSIAAGGRFLWFGT